MFSIKKDHWRNLDNAAKIFPATSNQNDTRVFRFYCECRDEVEENTLQQALDNTIVKFPLFLCVLRKGLFWFYFERSNLKPVVTKETSLPCLNLYLRDRKTLLFQVSYYKNRINFEVFHALTDGTGASLFLKELVKQYLILRYPEAQLPDISFMESDMTAEDQEADGFTKYYKQDHKKTKKKLKSCQITGPKTGYGELSITEGLVSCQAVLKKAKEYGVSMTVFLTAVFLCAIHEEMDKRQLKKSVALMLPVNLRKYFPSSSMLNFFGWIEPYYIFSQEDYDFQDVIEKVRDYFKVELTKEGLGHRFSHFMKMECNPILRFFPLSLKNIGMQLGAKLTKKDVTAVFSNLGTVNLPEEYVPYVERFGVYTSTIKPELSICSYEDELVICFASGFQNQNVERNFFRLLKKFDINSEILTDRYPEKQPIYQGLKFFKWFSFSCIAAVVACFMINYIVSPKLAWSFFVAGGALSMWITLAVGFFKRHNLLKNGIWQMLIISLACIIWDVSTGWHGWSVDYVMPCVYMIVQISMVIITRIQKLPVEEYMIYYILAGILGLFPVIILLFHTSQFPVFSVLCGGISFLWLVALLIFKGKDFFVELYKKLHF